MNLIYENSDGGIGNSGKYNGLVTAIKWKANAPGVASTSNERSYKFSYDKLMRLNAANYADRSGGGSWGNTGAYDEKGITYDLGGNILTMQRRAVISGSATDVDNLSYSYDGNKLDNVSDGSGGSYGTFGFKNLTGSGTAYGYDANGNINSDAKKGMTLDYNVLNRTERITITTATGRYIDYTYGADGNLIRKQAFDNSTLQKTTDYIGGFTYENGTLVYFAMAEGRVRNAGGTLTNEYIIRDQQGNARISFEDNAGTVLVRQENSYYPFGLSMPGNALPTSANKQLYNGGSEWQDDFADLPDLQQTFYRNYDPALGRFVAVDPVAEASVEMTTYHYALNNPIMFNDPMGDQADYSAFWNQALSYVGKNGASYNASQGWTEYGSSLEGFYAGAENMSRRGTFGLYDGWAANYLEAAGIFNSFGGGASTNVDAAGYLTTGIVRVDGSGNGVEQGGHAGYVTTFFVGNGNTNKTLNFDKAKTALDIGGGLYGFARAIVAPSGSWLGLNGKYYSVTWGGNGFTGSRAGALSAGRTYSKAGKIVVGATVVIGAIETFQGYKKDGGKFGYNAQRATASTAGNLIGGWGGAEGGAFIGGVIGSLFGGVGAIPGAAIGGFVGGWLGGKYGSEIAEAGVDNYYNK